VICLAPRAPGDSVRPRRPAGASARPLNFTVRAHVPHVSALWHHDPPSWHPPLCTSSGVEVVPILSSPALLSEVSH